MEKMVDLTAGMAVDDLGDDVGQANLSIDVIEFAGLDQ